MKQLLNSICVFIAMILLQVIVYSFLIEPYIISWGASDEEVGMPIAGDTLVPYSSSTRGITINAPSSRVWLWIIQLGADRSGFFSYDFLEKALGYQARVPEKSFPEFTDMVPGRVIPGTLANKKKLIEYRWPVLQVEPGKWFVLGNWGAFLIKPINEKQCRLIVRTHGRRIPSLGGRIGNFIMIPLHYIMERRMMIGLKSCAETGVNRSGVPDIFWFSGIVFSFMEIVILIIISSGGKSLIPVLFGVVWLLPLLVLNPEPVYSIGLLIVIIIILFFKISKGPLKN